MATIFVSHAVKDKAIVEEFVDLLHLGIGIQPDDTFCSSLPGMDIPTGAAFISHIKAQVTNPDLVLLMISPEFLKSQFCQHEVGASGPCLCRLSDHRPRLSITPTCEAC